MEVYTLYGVEKEVGQGAGSKGVPKKPALAHRPTISQTWVYLLF